MSAPAGSPSPTPLHGQLVVLLRWPAPLRCKRRLAVAVGPVRAAAIQARLALHVLRVASEVCRRISGSPGLGRIESVLAVTGLGSRAAARWGRACGLSRTVLQGEGGLGVRLMRQVRRARRQGASAVVLIGGDLPELAAADLAEAFRLLRRYPVVLGPAGDGGYWLIGLRDAAPRLFAGAASPIAWGSERVLEQTVAACAACGLTPAWLPQRCDLDRPTDLARWR